MLRTVPFCLMGLCVCLGVTVQSRAQDPHFTQFFASPLTLNPANTGLFSGIGRIAANYRSQWGSIATPFVTGTVSADFQLLPGIIPANDILGVGGLLLYDQTGGGGLKTEYAALSVAYHKALDMDGNITLGVGGQLAVVQKRIDFSKLIFEDQLTSNGFDPTLPSGEYIPNASITYPDYDVGLIYNQLIGQWSSFYAGLSYYHISQPHESFLGANYHLHSRFTAHGGGVIGFNASTSFYVSGLFMQQGSATEIAIGGALGLLVNGIPETPTVFYVGSWYRYRDAINPYVGLQVNNVQVGITYDVNTSSLQAASLHRGGMEISVIYTYPPPGPNLKRYKCPRF